MSTMRRKELTPEEQKNLIMKQVTQATAGLPPEPPPPPISQETFGQVGAAIVNAIIAPGPQVNEREVSKALDGGHGGMRDAEFRPSAPLPSIEDVIQHRPPPQVTEVLPCDLVQIINQRNSHYGLCFVIGAISEGQAHGFYMAQGPRKEFITVPVNDVHSYGKAAVMSKEPLSKEWMQQHGQMPATPIGNQGGGGR